MKKSRRFILIGSITLSVLLLMLYVVWEKPIRMAYANHFFNAGEYRKAQSIYEDLKIDLPTSHYVLNNLGLCLYKQGQYKTAVQNLRTAVTMPSSQKVRRNQSTKLTNILLYDFGNALYKNVAEPGTEDSLQYYAEALEGYRKSLEADPNDFNAKFNYELTALHLKQPPPKETENMLQNTQTDDQFKAKLTYEDEPSNGKDW